MLEDEAIIKVKTAWALSDIADDIERHPYQVTKVYV